MWPAPGVREPEPASELISGTPGVRVASRPLIVSAAVVNLIGKQTNETPKDGKAVLNFWTARLAGAKARHRLQRRAGEAEELPAFIDGRKPLPAAKRNLHLAQ